MKIYARCPKIDCNGSIVSDYEDYFCLNCGFRIRIPFTPSIMPEICSGSGTVADFGRIESGNKIVSECKECGFSVEIDHGNAFIEHRKREKYSAVPGGTNYVPHAGTFKSSAKEPV